MTKEFRGEKPSLAWVKWLVTKKRESVWTYSEEELAEYEAELIERYGLKK